MKTKRIPPPKGYWLSLDPDAIMGFHEVIVSTGTFKGIVYKRSYTSGPQGPDEYASLIWTCFPNKESREEDYQFFEKREDMLDAIKDPVTKAFFAKGLE